MIEIDIEIKNIEELIARLESMPGGFAAARMAALRRALSLLRSGMFDWIQSEGEGTWPKFHPLTQRYQKKGGLWHRRGRVLSRANWNWLMRFVKVWQNRTSFLGGIKFGDAATTMRGTTGEQAKKVERGARVAVTPKMRRMMGATRPKRSLISDRPGVSYFPLRASTKTLELPPRPIVAPVVQKYSARAIEAFAKTFGKEVEDFL